jgi:hypothetical protein
VLTGALDGDELDASLLLLAELGLVAATGSAVLQHLQRDRAQALPQRPDHALYK